MKLPLSIFTIAVALALIAISSYVTQPGERFVFLFAAAALAGGAVIAVVLILKPDHMTVLRF